MEKIEYKKMKAAILSKKTSVLFIIGALLNTVFAIALALLTEQITNNLDDINYTYVVLFLLIMLLAIINVGFTHYLIQSYAYKVACKLHLYLYNRLLSKKIEFFSTYDGGKLLNLLSSVAFSISNSLSTDRITLIQSVITITITFGFLLINSDILLLIFLGKGIKKERKN